jgi:lycopene cyclase domain-containing protein
MIYTVLAVAGVGVAIGVDLLVTRTRLVTRATFWTAYAIIVGFQLITNGLLTGIPVVRYRASAITGLRIAYAPVEDLLFGFALVLWTLAIWVWLGRRANRRPKDARSAG